MRVEHYLECQPFIEKLARRYRHSALGYEDAVSVGNLAVCEAWERYDSGKGVPFAGFAYVRARGAMTDAQRTARGTRTHPDQETLLSEAQWEAHCCTDDYCQGWDLFRAVSTLSSPDKRVALLVMAGERKADIAQVMGVHPGRISQRLQRIKKALG